MYVVQFAQVAMNLINILAVLIVLKIYPQIHVIKIASAMTFLLQPLIFRKYVRRRYKIDRKVSRDESALSQRWSCFGQNLAYFIHNNTDVVILTIFTSLKLVSVYSIYFLVINSLRGFILSISNAFAPILGRLIAQKNKEEATRAFYTYDFVISNVSAIVYGCCICLLPSFVMLYTNGINDINYFEPGFSVILVFSGLISCIREPYMSVVSAAGRFKETARGAYIEAALNISISLLLVSRFKLEGIAIGTLSSMLFRMMYQMVYVKKNLLDLSMIMIIKRAAITMITVSVAFIIVRNNGYSLTDSFLYWIKMGLSCFAIITLANIIANVFIEHGSVLDIIQHTKRGKR